MWRHTCCQIRPGRARGRRASSPIPSTLFSTSTWGWVFEQSFWRFSPVFSPQTRSFGFLQSSSVCLVSENMFASRKCGGLLLVLFAVCHQPLSAGDSKSAGLRVAPRSLRTEQIPGRGGVNFRHLGAWHADRGVVRAAAQGRASNQPFWHPELLIHTQKKLKLSCFL